MELTSSDSRCCERQKVIGIGSVGEMASRDNKNSSKTPATNLPIRDNPRAIANTEASRTQRTISNATQNTRSSNNESGRLSNSHAHGIHGQASSPATDLQTHITGALASSVTTTDAIPPGSERRSSKSDSIDLSENPEHPHARDMKNNIQELTKPFDGNDKK